MKKYEIAMIIISDSYSNMGLRAELFNAETSGWSICGRDEYSTIGDALEDEDLVPCYSLIRKHFPNEKFTKKISIFHLRKNLAEVDEEFAGWFSSTEEIDEDPYNAIPFGLYSLEDHAREEMRQERIDDLDSQAQLEEDILEWEWSR